MRRVLAIWILLGCFSPYGQAAPEIPLPEMRDAFRGLRDALVDRPAATASERQSNPEEGAGPQNLPFLLAQAGDAAGAVGAAPVHQCDLVAAYPDDPRKRSAGVSMAVMEKAPEVALDACLGAHAASPAEPRFEYQLARAYYAREKTDPRIRFHTNNAARKRYPAAVHLMGMLHMLGVGGAERDLGLARTHLQAAKELGMEVAASRALQDLDAIEKRQQQETAGAENRRLAAEAAEKSRKESAQQALKEKLAAQLLDAERKGIEFAKSSALKWSLSQKKDELSGQISATATSTQSNSRHSAQIQVSCAKGTLSVVATLPAGVVPLELKEVTRLNAFANAESSFVPAHTGRRRLNDLEVEDATILTGKFRNVFDLASLKVPGSHIEEYVPGSGRVPVWAYLAEFSTNAGPLVIKVPLYEASVRAVWAKC